DVQALAKSAADVNQEMQILNAVMTINEKQKTIIIPKVNAYFKNDLKGKKIAIWGLAFKPDTDDIREAPALYIIDELVNAGATVYAYDPEAMDNVSKTIGNKIHYGLNAYDILQQADALIICTEWSLFRTPDFDKMNAALKNKAVFDGRNLYSLEQMSEQGYYYASIGRATVVPE
ncbi:MAG: UDP binding domain-containing protein, partial [Bacteroidia bacterium]